MSGHAGRARRCARSCAPSSRRTSSTCTRTSSSATATTCSTLGVIDSLGFVELVEEVQSRYGIAVDDVEITEENFGSIDAIAAFVERKRAG